MRIVHNGLAYLQPPAYNMHGIPARVFPARVPLMGIKRLSAEMPAYMYGMVY